jgi:hypothetical protein
MTLEEINRELPNGFHDAGIRKIDLDFINPLIVVSMDIWVGQLGGPDPDCCRSGTLKILSPYLFFIEPPNPKYHFIPKGKAFIVDGDSIKVGLSPEVDRLLPVLPPNATVYRFFLEEWNSFLYLAGASVEFSWARKHPLS